jgi:imidazolonepropionase-like amidohydrolase
MPRIVFQGANLLDGDQPARAQSTVVVEGDRIGAVGRGRKLEKLEPRPDDRVVDLGGKTLMPGLVSCHFHASYHDITIQPEPLGVEKPPGYLMLCAARNARTALHCGITSYASAGANAGNVDAELKMAIEDGLVEGPRILAGSKGLDTHGGYTDTEKWWWELGNKGAQRFASGADEFRRVVRDEIKKGAGMIKVFLSGGHAVPHFAGGMSLSRAELDAVIETAHERGAKVRAHCAWRDVILEAVQAGLDVVDHGDQMDEACIEAMARARAFLVPSMFFTWQMLSPQAALALATEEQMAPLRAEFDNMVRRVPEAQRAGVRLVVGDDYGIIVLRHGRYAEELEFYVKTVGIAPLDVLRWATKNGGELMGLPVGTIEEGRLADLLVVDGDPSVDIALLQDPAKLRAIVKGGSFVKDAL